MPQPTRTPQPNIPRREQIADYTLREIIRLVQWVVSDGLPHDDAAIMQEVAAVLGVSHGSRIDSMIRTAISQARIL